MIDPYSETWRRVRKHATDEIEIARTELERSGMPAIDTEFRRGRIAALRALLALGEPKPDTPIQPGDHDIEY